MTPETESKLVDYLDKLLEVTHALRADLKRREQRDLEQQGRIPTGNPPRATGASGAASGACFPNYGRSKNQPVAGATPGDLAYYRAGCIRTLDDPAKAKFHAKERLLLAAIDAEMGKGGGQGSTAGTDAGEFGPDDNSEIPF